MHLQPLDSLKQVPLMKVTETEAEFRKICQRASRPLGLVPTMGFLHDGHMALVHCARAENTIVAVSIFVNPTQFEPNGDFSAYPRDLESDLSKLKEAGVDVVFVPSVEEMYPEGFDTSVDVGGVADRLEGKFRPGHFPRGGHGGVQAPVHGAPRQGLLRPERCPAVSGGKAPERRPQSRHRDCRGAHGARSGWSGHQQPQRVPHATGKEGGAGAVHVTVPGQGLVGARDQRPRRR